MSKKPTIYRVLFDVREMQHTYTVPMQPSNSMPPHTHPVNFRVSWPVALIGYPLRGLAHITDKPGELQRQRYSRPQNSTLVKLIDIKTSKITHVDYISEDTVPQWLLTDKILLFGSTTNCLKWVTKHLCWDAYSQEAALVQFFFYCEKKCNFNLMFTFSHIPFWLHSTF